MPRTPMGYLLSEMLRRRAVSAADLARGTGLAQSTCYEIVKGTRGAMQYHSLDLLLDWMDKEFPRAAGPSQSLLHLSGLVDTLTAERDELARRLAGQVAQAERQEQPPGRIIEQRLRRQITALEQQLRDLNSKLAAALEQVRRMEQSTNAVRIIERPSQEQMGMIARLQASLAEQRAQLVERDKSLGTIGNAAREIAAQRDALATERDNLRAELERARALRDAYGADAQRLTTDLDAAERLLAEQGEKLAALELTENTNTVLRSELHQLRDALDRRNAMGLAPAGAPPEEEPGQPVPVDFVVLGGLRKLSGKTATQGQQVKLTGELNNIKRICTALRKLDEQQTANWIENNSGEFLRGLRSGFVAKSSNGAHPTVRIEG